MNSPSIEILARHLLEREAQSSLPGKNSGGELAPVCNKLRVPLAKLAGNAGFSSLLSRALSLAVRQDSSLGGLGVTPEGLLVGLNTMPDDPATLHRAAVILVAELLNLLVEIIGESLTRSVVGTAWPDLHIDTGNLGSKEQS